MQISVDHYWESRFIGVGIHTKETEIFHKFTLQQAKELQEKLNSAIKNYETMEQVAQDVCSPDKAESEDPKPSDLMNF